MKRKDRKKIDKKGLVEFQEYKPKRRKGTIPRFIAEPVAALSAAPLLVMIILLFTVAAWWTEQYFVHIPDKQPIAAQVPNREQKLEVKVINQEFSNGDSTFTAAADEHYIIVNVSVTQHYGETIWLSPLLESYIIDSKGNKYQLTPVTLSHPFDAREYRSDEQAKGQLSYLVKRNAQNLQWCYEIQSRSIKVCQTISS